MSLNATRITLIPNHMAICVDNVSEFAWGVNLILLYVVISILMGTATFAVIDSLSAGQGHPTRWAVVVAVLWPGPQSPLVIDPR